MATAIHIELNLICVIILVNIALQSRRNVNQRTKRVLFRNVVYGLIITLSLDTMWMVVDGTSIPGGIIANKVLNALFLGAGVMMGSMWYLYVLDTMKYRLTTKLKAAVLLPGWIFLILNILSIWTEWIFSISAENVYIRGELFWLQSIASVGMLLVSLVHIVIAVIKGRPNVQPRVLRHLLYFYIIPVCGTLMTLPFSGMPGTWTCASVSVVLMYLDEQDRTILTDDLTGLNNRKNLEHIFEDYLKQQSEGKRLYLYMMDLDDFKEINDELGHSMGDQALVETAKLFRESCRGIQSVVMRYGGDEFLIMGFFADDDEAMAFKNSIKTRFHEWNKTHDTPYRLIPSIGFEHYQEGLSLREFISSADEMLYHEKRKHKAAGPMLAVR